MVAALLTDPTTAPDGGLAQVVSSIKKLYVIISKVKVSSGVLMIWIGYSCRSSGHSSDVCPDHAGVQICDEVALGRGAGWP